GRQTALALHPPRGPAAAAAAAGVDDHVAELAAVPALTAEEPPADDDPAADADVAVQVDQVLAADPDAALVLGQRAEIGVVGHGHRQAEAARGRERGTGRPVLPL